MLRPCPEHGADQVRSCRWCRHVLAMPVVRPSEVTPPLSVYEASRLAPHIRKTKRRPHLTKGQDAGIWKVEGRVDLLKLLWRDGYSGSQIAKRLGGVSRNAVIGKIHRLGLSGRATRFRTKESKPRQPRKRCTPFNQPQRPASVALFKTEPYTPPIKPHIPEAERKTLLQLEDKDCRFPVTDEAPHAFCGRAKIAGLPYCEDHARICFVPPHPRAGRPQPPGPLYRKGVLTGQIVPPVHLHELEDV